MRFDKEKWKSEEENVIDLIKRERKEREIYLESMKKEAEQKKLQAERIDRRLVRFIFLST